MWREPTLCLPRVTGSPLGLQWVFMRHFPEQNACANTSQEIPRSQGADILSSIYQTDQLRGRVWNRILLSSISPAQYPISQSRDTASVGKLEHVLLIFNIEPLQELPSLLGKPLEAPHPSKWAHPSRSSPKSTFFWRLFLLSPTQS